MKDIAIFMDNALLLIFFSIGIIKYICYIIYYLLVINVLLFVFYKNLHFIWNSIVIIISFLIEFHHKLISFLTFI